MHSRSKRRRAKMLCHRYSAERHNQPQENNESSTAERIKEVIASSDVVLSMEGVPARCNAIFQPWCKFFHLAVPFKSVDVLRSTNPEGIKTFSNWPTIPQLYVRENSWGSDIVGKCFRPESSRRC
jgi:monothiol glutaredoxin